MKINIKMLTEEAYLTLKANIEEVYKMIMDHPSDCTWLKGYLGFEPFETKKYEIEDFELLNDEDYSKVAFDNAKLIYENLKELPRYILCNLRFWAWFTLEKAYKQAIKCTPATGLTFLNYSWFAGAKSDMDNNSSRRDLMRGVMSRYFFMIEVSKDETLADKYELTKFLLTCTEAYRNIIYRNIGMLPNITLGYLRALKDFSERNHVELVKAHARLLFLEASRLGSVKLVDLLDKKEVYDALYPKLEYIHKYELGRDK